MPGKIRVVISEDRPTEMEYFKQKLSEFDDIEIVGEAANPDQALEVVRLQKPNVVLFDLNYDGYSHKASFDAIAEARRLFPQTRFLAFTAYFDDCADDALKAGCADVLYKGTRVGVPEVHAAIIAVARRRMEDQLTWDDVHATAAEVDAFMAFVREGDIDGAAKARSVSYYTERRQLDDLRGKLAAATGEIVDSMAKAVTLAMRYSLIDRHDCGPAE